MAWELIIDEKMNQDFVGHAEKATYSFNLPPGPTDWIAQQVVDAFADQLAEENSVPLEIRLWKDDSPLFYTSYVGEVVATASPLWWNIIIAGALLAIIAVAIAFTINDVEDITKYIGEVAPGTLPIIAIAGIGLLAFGIVFIISQKSGRSA